MISAAPSWSRTRVAIFMISASGRHSNTAPTGAARTSGGSSTSKRGDRLGGGAEYQLAVVVDIDRAFVPAGLALHHLVDRQHVEIFVGENDRRAVGHVVDAVVPGDVAHARQRRPLLVAQHRIDLDQMDAERLIERRQHPQRAQRIRHHGAAAGPELDQPQQRRRADRLPYRRRPQARAIRRTSGSLRARW